KTARRDAFVRWDGNATAKEMVRDWNGVTGNNNDHLFPLCSRYVPSRRSPKFIKTNAAPSVLGSGASSFYASEFDTAIRNPKWKKREQWEPTAKSAGYGSAVVGTGHGTELTSKRAILFTEYSV